MKKLNLNVDALRVESFSTEKTGETTRGTVRGHSALTGDEGCWSQVICSNQESVCVCNTTVTARFPECAGTD